MRVLVLGAGVVGLTCAIELRAHGHAVRVRTKRRTPGTCSDRAAALFLPLAVERPLDRVLALARASLPRVAELAEDQGSGVGWIELVESAEASRQAPDWDGCGLAWRRTTEQELAIGERAGFVARAPMIDMAVHMPWLEQRLLAAGGEIEAGEVTRLEAAAAGFDAVVHCSGLGARDLVPDPGVQPIRGQVLYLPWRAVPSGVPRGRGWVDEASFAYVLPRRDGLVLGGTYEPGVAREEPDATTARSIAARCVALLPALAGADFSSASSGVGLRPGRAKLRLEAEPPNAACGVPVVHCYGHGPHGVTLAWGCAQEVVRLLGAWI